MANTKGKFSKILKEHGYKSFDELSIATGIPKATLYGRFNRGVSFEEAIIPGHMEYSGCKCTVFGKTYPSRSAACRACGVRIDQIKELVYSYNSQFDYELEQYCIRHNKKPKDDIMDTRESMIKENEELINAVKSVSPIARYWLMNCPKRVN